MGSYEKNEKQYIFHAGQNPTFTSYFIMQPDEQLGVAILSNLNTSFTTAIGQGVMDLWEGNDVANTHSSGDQKLDRIVTILCIVVGCFGVMFILLSLRTVSKFVRKQRIRTKLNVKRILLLSVHTLVAAAILTLTLMFPKIFFQGLPLAFIKVWAPTTISVFLYSVIVVNIIYYLIGLLLIFTKKTKLN